MLTGLYSAASAMDTAAQRHDVIANNLAHAQHPGYRRRVPVDGTFESKLLGDAADPEAEPPLSTLGTSSAGNIVDFTPGPFIQTGRSLDFAIQGDGFFVVEGPNGPLYTRNGVFTLDAEGQLVTADGLAVSGGSGPIQLPPETSLEQLRITRDGKLVEGTQELGEIRIVSFENPELLQAAGVSLFQAPDDVFPVDSEAFVVQGTREGSNVSPVLEMVRMIDGMRQYEAAANALKAITEAVQQNVNPASV